MRARPQGTPVTRSGERPVATPAAPSAKTTATPGDNSPRDTLGFTGTFGGGFGADEFNFAKFLDDPPAEGSPPDDAKQ